MGISPLYSQNALTSHEIIFIGRTRYFQLISEDSMGYYILGSYDEHTFPKSN